MRDNLLVILMKGCTLNDPYIPLVFHLTLSKATLLGTSIHSDVPGNWIIYQNLMKTDQN